MKYSFLVLVILIITIFLCGCDGTNKDNNNSGKQLIEEQTEANHIYKKLYVKLNNSKQFMDITNFSGTILEASKTVTEPLLTEEYSKIGDVFVVYKGSTEQVEFGEIYTDADDNMYIYAFENENKALYKIEEQQTNS